MVMRDNVAAVLGLSMGVVLCLPANSQEKPALNPVLLEANGIQADPTKNTHDALVAAVTSNDWAVPVEIIGCNEPGCIGERTYSVYTPLPVGEIKGAWSICALLPHVKDPYWLGQDAGLVAEAQRTGVTLQVYEAGGYPEIGKQIDQLTNCVASGADAVVIGAVSNEALNPEINRITEMGIPVIDMVNGVTSPDVSGRALFDYCTLGGNLGRHLAATGEDIKAVWFPGPAGVGSLEQLMSCFREQAEGSSVEVVGVLYGDTGKDVQRDLVENAIEAYPEMNYIVGSAVTVDAAIGPLRERGLNDKIRLASYYFTPEVFDLLSEGEATCASAGNDMILSRIAIDMAIRVLEGKPLNGGSHLGMAAQVICGPSAGEEYNNIDTLVKEMNLAPEGFKPIFSVN